MLIREAELKGSRDPPMIARHAELQREIREHDWQASGLGKAAPLARLGEVSAALEESGQMPGGHRSPGTARWSRYWCGADRRASSGSATSKRPPRPPGG